MSCPTPPSLPLCSDLPQLCPGYNGETPENLKAQDKETATKLSYMNSFKLVEAVLESMPQLSIQTSAFFKVGGDLLFFSFSASVGIISLIVALHTFLTTNEDIKNAMRALRVIFGADAVAAPAPAIPPPPVELPPPLHTSY